MIKLKLVFLFLFINLINPEAAQIDTLMVVSKSMNKSIPNIVIIPDNYTTQKEDFSVSVSYTHLTLPTRIRV